MRLGHLLALPMLVVSAACLVVDLGQPQRFWHMIFESERFPLPIFKAYSPMSFGSAILALFGVVVFLSFVDQVLGRGRWFHAPGNPSGKVLSVLGAIGGLALAGYTGVLLNVTNEPVWGNSPWISALFVFSGISTGFALLLLVSRRLPRSTEEKLSDADNYLMLLELATLVIFLVSLWVVGIGARFVFSSPVVILFALVLVVGLLAPLLLHWRPSLAGGLPSASVLAAVMALIGGFLLRWAVLAGPQGIGL
jgi:formate-dependent nitrite reductase membrane component NrfD